MKIEQLWVELQRFSGAYGITEMTLQEYLILLTDLIYTYWRF
jgi:hypothetical protein